ncbi:MAG: beta-ribofuranosylaminobenzene 5'-phosphate synthase family protein [Candidatus Eutrophobiaceae bacterium]
MKTCARLHMGFLDMHGGLGRKFGSLGAGIDAFHTHLTVQQSPSFTASGAGAEQALKYARLLLKEWRIEQAVEIRMLEAIPRHAGLGSGTQMALAVGMGLSRLFDKSIEAHELAGLLHRCSRSGIGLGVFEHGGFLLDAGRSNSSGAPPLIARLEFPEQWRFLLVLDKDSQGLSGKDELRAFAQLTPMDEAQSGRLCRLALMQCLPALYERDCQCFGAGITEIQQAIGRLFHNQQQGLYSSPKVARVMNVVQALGAMGWGQSSWGSTGFALFDGQEPAYAALRTLQDKFPKQQELLLKICQVRNCSASIQTHDDSEIAATLRQPSLEVNETG